jgi:signal transduction histidine kinase
MMVFYYQFIRNFTNKRPGLLVYLGYGLWVTFSVSAILSFTLREAYFSEGELILNYNPIMFNAQSAAASIFMFAAIAALVRHYRATTEPLVRTRTSYLLIGISIFFLFGVTDLVPALLKYPLDYVGGVINGLIITYVILKYQLLDIKLIARKGLVYSGLTVLLTAMYLILLFSLQTAFHGWFGLSSLALAAVFAILVAVFFNPFRDLLQRMIDRLFYRETYDYRQVLFSFSNKISNVLDLGELAQAILEPIVNTMHIRHAALLFPDNDSGEFSTRFAQQAQKDEESSAKLRLVNDSSIVRWLAREGKALKREQIDILPQFKGLWEVERVALNALEVQLFCPIKSRGDLIGIIGLGEKQSDTPYSDEEIDLLMTMANEAAVVLENARMLDSLKTQQQQVEGLLTQVVQAQEEERGRISADLHDSVAQWLVATSYRIQSFSQALSRNKDSKVHAELADMEDTLSRSVKELRRVVVGLRPPALDELGLAHALRQSLDDLKADRIYCKFSLVGKPVRLPETTEIAVYRIVQEALTNIRKHAQASRVNLRLKFKDDGLSVEVRDNGKGFVPGQTLSSDRSVGQIGLLGMRQRAEMLGGEFSIKTHERVGTTIILNLPIPPQVEEG